MTLPNQEELRVIVTLMMALLPLGLAGLGTWLTVKVVEGQGAKDTTAMETGAALCWLGAVITGVLMFGAVRLTH